MWSRGWYLYLNSNGGLQLGFVKTTVVTICSTGPRTGRGSVCCSARHEAPQVPGRGKSPKKYLSYKKLYLFHLFHYPCFCQGELKVLKCSANLPPYCNKFLHWPNWTSFKWECQACQGGKLLDWHQSRSRGGQNVNGTHLQVNCWDIKCYDHIPHLWFITTS